MDNKKITATKDTTNTSPVHDFWKNLAALLKVKTIITLVIMAVLSINGSIEPDKFLTIATMVVAFYFGTQSEKKP